MVKTGELLYLAVSPSISAGTLLENCCGAKGRIIQFVKGSSDLDPSFNLHPIKDRVFSVPKLDLIQLLNEVRGMEKLERGVKYPAAK